MPARKPLPTDAELRERLAALPPAERDRFLNSLEELEARSLGLQWGVWGHLGQHAPSGDWRTWVIMAGRGFGKTRAGAEWVRAIVRAVPNARIALVAASLDEARRIMVEGASGLLEVAVHEIDFFHPTTRLLRFANGAEATLFSGASPEQLRGPEHHAAWCDELAKWERPGETWDMLQLGLRLGEFPRALVTTTPRPGKILRRIMDEPGCFVTGGPTYANPHLPKAFVSTVDRLYAGTRLGRQELQGELLTDIEGALWTADLIERCRSTGFDRLSARPERSAGREVEGRVLPDTGTLRPSTTGFGLRSGRADQSGFLSSVRPEPVEGLLFPSDGSAAGESRASTSSARTELGDQRWARVVIGVDPPASGGTCGIVACARDGEGIAHVLADHSVAGRAPEAWARAVAAAAEIHRADRVVAERNQGGDMVRSVLRAAETALPVKLVHASVGKAARAEPIHALFEAGRVRLHGRFPDLEAELCGLIVGGGYQGPGSSPDRADAMVWALTELMLEDRSAAPRVRGI